MTDLGPLDVARLLAKALAYGASLLAAGVALFLAAHAPEAETARASRRFAAVAALAGIALAGGLFALEALFLVGGDMTAAFDPMLLGVVLDTPIGDAQAARAAGLALIALLALGPVAVWPAAVGALVVAASFALVGHSLREPRLALGLLVTLHVAAAAYWIGAFAPLHRAAGRAPAAEAGRLTESFGRVATWIVAGLVVAGVALVLVLAGVSPAIVATPWGAGLVVKIALVAALLALAALNKLRLSPRLAAGDPRAAIVLRRSIAAEAVLAAAILLATVAMTTLGSPPA